MKNSLIERLAKLLAKLPGLGTRSSNRIALSLSQQKNRESLLSPLIRLLTEVEQSIHTCKICGNLDNSDPCFLCLDKTRDTSILCVIDGIEDLWAIENTCRYRGLYHVLSGMRSSVKGVDREDLHLERLSSRVEQGGITEVILALNPTLEGQTTSYMVAELLADKEVKVSQIALGVPLGGELGYLDEGTLTMALMTRQPFYKV